MHSSGARSVVPHVIFHYQISNIVPPQVCAVAAQPGHTKELQTVQLERGLRIIDSPGVVFDDADDSLDSAGRARAARGSVLLRNVIKVEDIEDPVEIGEFRPSFRKK